MPSLLLLLACGAEPTDSVGPDPTDSVPDSTPSESAPTESAPTGTGSGDDTGPAPPDSLGALTLEVDAAVVTLLHARFTDPGVDEVWVEERHEGGDWAVVPLVGPGEAVVLGVPGDTPVEARAAARYGATVVYSEVAVATTGTVPAELLVPEVVAWDPGRADPGGFVMVSVDHDADTYGPPFYVEIVDRAGRVVWYHQTPDDLTTLYASVALDGSHVWWDESDLFFLYPAEPRVVRQTLDGRWSETVPLPGMGQAVTEGPDGSWFYEARESPPYGVVQRGADGGLATVWDCSAWVGARGLDPNYCRFNACNWSPTHGTVLASSFWADTVFEVDVATGEVLRQMGQLAVGEPWAFDPPESQFDYQHDPHWLDDGHLLVSTHVPGDYGVQVAAEYEVDDTTRTLTRVWAYTSTDRFATQLGEARRLSNGDTLQGYGQDGALREVTPEGDVVWEVAWPSDTSGYRVIGHASVIEDLYALNAGPAG